MMLMPYSGGGGSSASQGNWRTNWIGLQLTEANMLRPMISMATKPKISESDAEVAEIDRPDLRVADDVRASRRTTPVPSRSIRAAATPMSRFCGPHLNLGEDVLVVGHGRSPSIA